MVDRQTYSKIMPAANMNCQAGGRANSELCASIKL